MSFPAGYLPSKEFDWWLNAHTGISRNWPPLTQNPVTARATFDAGGSGGPKAESRAGGTRGAGVPGAQYSVPSTQSSAPSPSPFLGPDGNWKLPPGAPQPAIAPFDTKKAKEHQAAWAKHMNLPVEETNSIGMKFAIIPPGEFDMGSMAEEIAAEIERGKRAKESQGYLDRVSSEGPRHRVKITRPLYVAVYQVTQGEYEKVMGVNPSAFTEKQMESSAFKPPLSEYEVKYRETYVKKVEGKDTSRHPVETVTWEKAMEFCHKLSAMPAERAARRVYRLPTEAEWEYACRVGTTTRWSCGDDEAGLADVGWYNKNAGGKTHPVGEKKPNGWGLYDMHGNVWEWCMDWYGGDFYRQSRPVDPVGPPGGSNRVLRGGSWRSAAGDCRSANRLRHQPGYRDDYLGLRVLLVPAE
jgi:formylglycine-generating enzyme required for sulfatase activity